MFMPLKPGDKVALVAPGGRISDERLEAGAAALSVAGFVPFIHPQCRLREGCFAGDEAARAAALHEMYADPSVRAIWCARGGYGAARLIDRLDDNLIAQNPKPLVGHSDITALHLALFHRLGRVGVFGRMAIDAARSPSAEAEAQLWAFLRGQPTDPLALPGARPRVLVAGAAEGVLLGGNLSTLVSLLGSADAPRLEGALLFFEEVREELYRFDRLLLQLRRAGLAGVRGVVVGGLSKMTDDPDDPFGRDLEGIVRDHFGALGVPVVMDVPAGHLAAAATLPIGAKMCLVAEDTVSLSLSAPVFA